MRLEPSEMFRVLGAETRVKIIELLKCRGPLGTKRIAAVCGISPAAVSQHLRVLRQAGLVRNERKGYWIPYSVDEEALQDCCCLLNEVCTCGREETDRIRGQRPDRDSLGSLTRYKRQLERELQRIEDRISEIKRGEK